jgi:hypothetical protein
VLRDEGPYLIWGTGANVSIGVAGLRYFVKPSETPCKRFQLGWWVVKNNDELRMGLHEFTHADARALSSGFGIVFLDSDYSIKTRQEYFYTSPAWDSLLTWVCSHPRLASQATDDYLIGWRHRMAIELAIAAGSY